MMRFWALIFIQVLAAGALAQRSPCDQCFHLDPDKFYLKLHSAKISLLIDTRPEEEFSKERIPGSVHAFSRDKLLEITDSLNRQHPIFLYCENDQRSRIACAVLNDRGFRKVYNLEGGLVAWRLTSYAMDRKRIKKKSRPQL